MGADREKRRLKGNRHSAVLFRSDPESAGASAEAGG